MVVDTITMSDLDKPMENILITSSFGNIELPTNELYNFINTCMIKKQENDNKIYAEMKNFFDDSRYETQFHAISPHEAGAMLKCLFSVFSTQLLHLQLAFCVLTSVVSESEYPPSS